MKRLIMSGLGLLFFMMCIFDVSGAPVKEEDGWIEEGWFWSTPATDTSAAEEAEASVARQAEAVEAEQITLASAPGAEETAAAAAAAQAEVVKGLNAKAEAEEEEAAAEVVKGLNAKAQAEEKEANEQGPPPAPAPAPGNADGGDVDDTDEGKVVDGKLEKLSPAKRAIAIAAMQAKVEDKAEKRQGRQIMCNTLCGAFQEDTSNFPKKQSIACQKQCVDTGSCSQTCCGYFRGHDHVASIGCDKFEAVQPSEPHHKKSMSREQAVKIEHKKKVLKSLKDGSRGNTNASLETPEEAAVKAGAKHEEKIAWGVKDAIDKVCEHE